MKNKTSITRLFAILVSALMMVFAMSAFAVAEDYSFYDETERYIDEGGLSQEIRPGNGEGEFKVLAIDWLPAETLTLGSGWYLMAGGGNITSSQARQRTTHGPSRPSTPTSITRSASGSSLQTAFRRTGGRIRHREYTSFWTASSASTTRANNRRRRSTGVYLPLNPDFRPLRPWTMSGGL